MTGENPCKVVVAAFLDERGADRVLSELAVMIDADLTRHREPECLDGYSKPLNVRDDRHSLPQECVALARGEWVQRVASGC